MIKEYYMRPPTVTAVQWTGENFDEIKAYAPALDITGDFTTKELRYQDKQDFTVKIVIGDFLVNDGRLRILSESDFNSKYVAVKEEEK